MRILRVVSLPSRIASRPPRDSGVWLQARGPFLWLSQAYRSVSSRGEYQFNEVNVSASWIVAFRKVRRASAFKAYYDGIRAANLFFWEAVQMGTYIGCFFGPHQELPSLKGRAFYYCMHP
eukprot:1161561-Pelagomonas_calceolata.AAC.1